MRSTNNCRSPNRHKTDQLVGETMKRYGRIDILINNTGAIFRPGDWKGDRATWQKTIDTNLTSAWLMIREAAPIIQKQKSGTIVNLTSVYGILGAAPVEQFRQETPLKRIAEPEEIVRAVLFLASDESSYITGQMLVVDGGYSLK